MKMTLNMMEYLTKDKTTKYLYGYTVSYKGIALHIRKDGSLWIISLFNSGILTAGHGYSLKQAIQAFDENEGRLIDDWKLEAGHKHLHMLADSARLFNSRQIIKYEISDNYRICYGTEVKAGDFI